MGDKIEVMGDEMKVMGDNLPCLAESALCKHKAVAPSGAKVLGFAK